MSARGSFEVFAAKARGERPAGFALARELSSEIARDALERTPDAALEATHARLMTVLWAELGAPSMLDAAARRPLPASPAARGRSPCASLLEVKLELARRLLRPCRLCALECGVDRRAGRAGACDLGPGLARYLDFVHEGEEPEVSPTHAILLAGCNYRCSYCSEWDHVAHPERDAETPPATLARSIDARRRAGVASLSWIGGEPLVNLPGILEALALTTVSVPLVWNSNGHATPGASDLIEGIVDASVLDLKHGNDACARAVARAPRYLETVVPAIARAVRESFTIVRHLVLPGHVECCTLPALALIAREVPGVRVNLMAQYRPNGRDLPGLDRRPTGDELVRSLEAARTLGLDLGARGRLEGQRPVVVEGGAGAFESIVHIDADGSVTFENLSTDLDALARTLGPRLPSLGDETRA